MKRCSKCERDRPLNEFQRRSKNRDGYSGICKECKRKYDNAHYRNNPSRRAYIRANSEKRIAEVRDWLMQYLREHPCVDCGEKDIMVLEFDHQRDKLMDISTLIRRGSLQTVKNEVAKCEVRCANDHRRKTAKDFNHWRLAL